MSLTKEELQSERLVDFLNVLIRHDRAAFEVCDAAATRLSAIRPRARIRQIGEDHLRRVDKLSRHVTALGGLPTREKADLKHGRQAARLISGDRTLLRVLLEDEQVVADAYDSAVKRDMPTTDLREVVARGYRHQRSHHRWLQQSLDASRQ